MLCLASCNQGWPHYQNVLLKTPGLSEVEKVSLLAEVDFAQDI